MCVCVRVRLQATKVHAGYSWMGCLYSYVCTCVCVRVCVYVCALNVCVYIRVFCEIFCACM